MPRVHIKVYTSLVLPIFPCASPAWRPWLEDSVNILESFQRRIAFKCSVDPEMIEPSPITQVNDDHDLGLAKLLIGNLDFDDSKDYNAHS